MSEIRWSWIPLKHGLVKTFPTAPMIYCLYCITCSSTISNCTTCWHGSHAENPADLHIDFIISGRKCFSVLSLWGHIFLAEYNFSRWPMAVILFLKGPFQCMSNICNFVNMIFKMAAMSAILENWRSCFSFSHN